jgi:hypothetical protein
MSPCFWFRLCTCVALSVNYKYSYGIPQCIVRCGVCIPCAWYASYITMEIVGNRSRTCPGHIFSSYAQNSYIRCSAGMHCPAWNVLGVQSVWLWCIAMHKSNFTVHQTILWCIPCTTYVHSGASALMDMYRYVLCQDFHYTNVSDMHRASPSECTIILIVH